MITNLDFTPTAKHRERLWLITGTALTFVVMLASNASAQDIKTPFGPGEARLYLRNAADKARLIQKQKSKTFEEFKASVTKEPFEGGKYIVNGDTPIATEAELRTFYEENVEASPKEVSEFTVMRKLGKDIIWSDEKKKNISYCVASAAADIGGFGSRYNTVVGAMADATRAWEEVADVKFIHVMAEDSNCTANNNKVTFDVRPVNINAYLARAFFPDEPRATSNVLIDNSSFELPSGGKLSLTGILRHELGHTLGARHEQTRPQAGTCFEDNDWRGVTDYDALSVMHYPQCNGKGDWSLKLTVQDKNGIACLYKPAPGFVIDTNICKPAQ